MLLSPTQVRLVLQYRSELFSSFALGGESSVGPRSMLSSYNSAATEAARQAPEKGLARHHFTKPPAAAGVAP